MKVTQYRDGIGVWRFACCLREVAKGHAETCAITLQCNECGKTWRVRADPKRWPACPRCQGADWDVKDPK